MCVCVCVWWWRWWWDTRHSHGSASLVCRYGGMGYTAAGNEAEAWWTFAIHPDWIGKVMVQRMQKVL